MSKSSSAALDVFVGLILMAVILGCVALWNERLYGDWTCAFSRCVRVKS